MNSNFTQSYLRAGVEPLNFALEVMQRRSHHRGVRDNRSPFHFSEDTGINTAHYGAGVVIEATRINLSGAQSALARSAVVRQALAPPLLAAIKP